MIHQLPLADGAVAVVFRLPAAIWADRVQVVGDFNGWSTSATPMRLGEQYWEAQITLAAGSRYAYAYLVDGVDWRTECASLEPAADSNPHLCTMLPRAITYAQ